MLGNFFKYQHLLFNVLIYKLIYKLIYSLIYIYRYSHTLLQEV
jgi:hypothetical protein